MESQLAFLDCPAWLDEECLARCVLPAAVLRRFIIESTSGPLESVAIKCPIGHFFIAPIEFLSLESNRGTPYEDPSTPIRSEELNLSPNGLRVRRPGYPCCSRPVS